MSRAAFHAVIDWIQAMMGLTGPALVDALAGKLGELERVTPPELEILRGIVARLLMRMAPLPDPERREAALMKVLEAHDVVLLRAAVEEWRAEPARARLDPRIAIVLRVIAERYADRGAIRLEALAERVRVSPTYLSRLITRETGATLGAHVRQRRVFAAAAMLRETRQPLRQIAKAAGYNSAADFRRDFKRVLGSPPRIYLRHRPDAP